MPTSDYEAVDRCIYYRYLRAIAYRQALKMGVENEKAEDAAGDFLIHMTASRRWERWADTGYNGPYATACSRNFIFRRIRNDEESNNATICIDDLPDATFDTDPHAITSEREFRCILRHELQKLGHRDRLLISLRFVSQLQYAQIALLVGSSPDAVRVATARVLARLKSRMIRCQDHVAAPPPAQSGQQTITLSDRRLHA